MLFLSTSFEVTQPPTAVDPAQSPDHSRGIVVFSASPPYTTAIRLAIPARITTTDTMPRIWGVVNN